LDNSGVKRVLAPRPSATAGKKVFTYTGENVGIPAGNAPSILAKDYTITAEITVPEGGAEGMIVTFGGRFGGYGLFLQQGKPVFLYNLLNLKRYRWEGGIGGKIDKNLNNGVNPVPPRPALQKRGSAPPRSVCPGPRRSG
jgi:arylsulfatase